tara:strand:+ start:104 stop:1090 length:987 start_codon:yes stop_codon:yes gene_type:complete
MKKKVLVTGGAGCIGFEVSKQLRKYGFEPIIYDLAEKIMQISKYNEINKYICGSILDKAMLNLSMKSVDYVIHLAALLGVERTETEPLRCLEINIEGTKNVIEACLTNNINKFIFASSSEVYGEPVEKKVSEVSMTQGKTVYAISKLAGEEYLKAVCKDHKIFKGIILRYFNTFGPFQTAQFAIPNFISSVKKKKEPLVNGTGKQVRSYCFVSDTARATVLALKYNVKNKDNFEVFNIGNPNNNISVLNLAKKIIKLSKEKNLKPEIDKDFQITDRKKNREIFSRICDISKAKKILGFNPKVKLNEGLSKTIDSNQIWPNWPNEISKN